MTAAAFVITLVLCAWTVSLAVLGERERTRETAKKCDFITALVGTAALIVGIITTQITVSRVADEIAELEESIRTCYAIAFIVTGVFFVICSVTSLMSMANRKLRGGFAHKIRVTMIAVSGVFVLSLALIGCIATYTYVGMSVFAMTAGLGLMLRYCSLIENKGVGNEK